MSEALLAAVLLALALSPPIEATAGALALADINVDADGGPGPQPRSPSHHRTLSADRSLSGVEGLTPRHDHRTLSGVEGPPANAPADYQLSGAYPPAPRVRIVSRDWRDPAPPSTPLGERYGICYVNAFQSQPEMFGWWRRWHPGLLLRDRRGRLVGDPNWPGEVLLDVSTRAKRTRLLAIADRWMHRCRRSGYEAVEPDNLDSFTRSRGLLHRSQAAAMARGLARRGHRLGLAVAQKNTVELLARRRAIGFDFAVAEDCQQYAECGRYLRAYGTAVIEIEYPDGAGPAGYREACRRRGALISIVYRDRQLLPRGRPGYRFATC